MIVVAKGKFEDKRLKEKDTIIEIKIDIEELAYEDKSVDLIILEHFEDLDRSGCTCSFSESQNHCDCDGYGFTYEYEILEIREECRRCKDCEYYHNEVCCNGDGPLAADFVPENYGCVLFEKGDKNGI